VWRPRPRPAPAAAPRSAGNTTTPTRNNYGF
jgi:hypothetical protein